MNRMARGEDAICQVPFYASPSSPLRSRVHPSPDISSRMSLSVAALFRLHFTQFSFLPPLHRLPHHTVDALLIGHLNNKTTVKEESQTSAVSTARGDDGTYVSLDRRFRHLRTATMATSKSLVPFLDSPGTAAEERAVNTRALARSYRHERSQDSEPRLECLHGSYGRRDGLLNLLSLAARDAFPDTSSACTIRGDSEVITRPPCELRATIATLIQGPLWC